MISKIKTVFHHGDHLQMKYTLSTYKTPTYYLNDQNYIISSIVNVHIAYVQKKEVTK